MDKNKLIEQALLAQKNAKCKYSDFPVGCALQTKDGEVIFGCNVESAVYPSTLCAERVAIYSAISRGITDYKAVAIVSDNAAKPCGACRQIMYEYLGDIPIYIADSNGDNQNEHTINELLPYPFG